MECSHMGLHFPSLQLATATAGEHCPHFSPVLNHGGKGKRGEEGQICQVPEQAGDSAGLPVTWESHLLWPEVKGAG